MSGCAMQLVLDLAIATTSNFVFAWSYSYQANLLLSYLAKPFNVFSCGIISESCNDIASRLIRYTYINM